MPVLSTFYGIIVRMYRETGRKHNLPHIHAEYSGQEIAVALDGTILEGDFPKGKMKLLEAWMEIHREELEANWTLISNGEQVSRVVCRAGGRFSRMRHLARAAHSLDVGKGVAARAAFAANWR